MVDIDRKAMMQMIRFTPEEEKALRNMMDEARTNPETLLILGIFRDVLVFEHMIQSHVLRFECEVADLRERIEKLEQRKISSKR